LREGDIAFARAFQPLYRLDIVSAGSLHIVPKPLEPVADKLGQKRLLVCEVIIGRLPG
jgi:hypothetical protein